MDRKYVEPKELRAWWPYVRPRLEKILKKSPEFWIPEDVYADCLAGHSMLWAFISDSKPIGFVVLKPVQADLHIWCAYADGDGWRDGAWEHLLVIARQGGAKHLTFDSWRPGWQRLAKRLGFQPRKWVMEVSK
jgi:hypothetical protein